MGLAFRINIQNLSVTPPSGEIVMTSFPLCKQMLLYHTLTILTNHDAPFASRDQSLQINRVQQ